MAAITGAALVAGATVYAASEQRKAGKEAAAAIEKGKVDPDKVARQTREQSLENIRAALAAEQEFTPENAQVRRESVRALLPLISDQTAEAQQAQIDRDIAAGGDAEQSALLSEAIQQAREDLALGGELDVETRNEIARKAIAQAGNTGRARFLVPRDIGRSALDLRTERLERAGQFGQVEQSRFQQSFENLQRLRQLRESLAGSRVGRGISLANFGQFLAPPDVGLAPGEYAGLFIQNQNLGAQAAATRAEMRARSAQSIAEGASALGGAMYGGSSIFNTRKQSGSTGF